MSDKPWRNADTLRKLYHDKGYSSREVAKKLDCGKKTILRWLDKHDIEKERSPKQTREEKLDADTISELYWSEKMSGYEIAEKLGVSSNAVYSLMDDKNIPRRDKSESAKLKPMPKELVETGAPEWVYDELRKQPANLTHGSNGHLIWRVSDKGTYHAVGVHRLVAIANGEDPDEIFGGMHVHHKNGIPWDNRPNNLEVMSKSEHHSLHNDPNKELEYEC